MTSFLVSVTNNSGFDLTPSNPHFNYPGFTVSGLGLILNNETQVIEFTLDNPKDPCTFSCNFDVSGHPLKLYLHLNNPLLGSDVGQIKLATSYVEKTWGFYEMSLGSVSGCAADSLKIIVPPLSLVSIIN
jgi:hypothetical protein